MPNPTLTTDDARVPSAAKDKAPPEAEDFLPSTFKYNQVDFPGGPAVKNPPAYEGDMGLIPGPGRFYVLWGNWAQVPQLLSPSAATTEANMPWSPCSAMRSHHNRKPENHN